MNAVNTIETTKHLPPEQSRPEQTGPEQTGSAGLTGLSTLNALAARSAVESDRTGELATDVVESLVSTGVAGHFVPARWNGRQGSIEELTTAMVELGASCASASWVGSMFAYTGRFATHLPLPAQEEIWADDPNVIWASGLVPTGSSSPVDGGFRLSGSWGYVSGCEFADWLLLAGPQAGPNSGPPLFHAVPRRDTRVERTWDSIGMRATGSHTVVLEDVMVPAHRVVPVPVVVSGRNATSTAAQHNLPLPALGGLTCVAPALGAARQTLVTSGETTAAKRPAMPAEARVMFDDSFTRAAAELDAATLLIERIVAVLDAGLAPKFALRNARDAAWVAQTLRDLVQKLVNIGGTAAQNRFGCLDRIWRDVFTATSHAALRFDKIAGRYTETQIPA